MTDIYGLRCKCHGTRWYESVRERDAAAITYQCRQEWITATKLPGGRKGIILPCPDCGAKKGRERDGDYSVCAECGGDRHRVRLTAEFSAAIDAYQNGTGTLERLVTESFNQEFTDIVEGQP